MNLKKKSKPDNDNIYKNQVYLNNNRGWHQADSFYKTLFISKIINRNNISFKTCADVGCGAGLVTEILAKKYPNIKFTGYDISSDSQKFWKYRSKLQNLELNNEDILLNKKSYDLVICLDVFEHLEDCFSFLRNLSKVSKRFIFNIPLDMNVMKILTNGIKYARDEVGHLHYFSEYTALQTLRDCGYRIEDSFLSAAFLSTAPRNKRQLAILPLRLLTLVLGKSFGAKVFGGQSLVVYAKSN